MNAFKERQNKLDEMKHVDEIETRAQKAIHDHPKGWEPGIAWDGTQGELTTPPVESAPDAKLWERIILDFGLSPDELEIVDGSLSLIGWKSPVKGAQPDWPEDQKTVNLTRYKVRLVKKRGFEARADIDELIQQIKRMKPAKPVIALDDEERALVAILGDWQMGKAEGDGSAGSVERILASLGALVERIKDFRKMGRPITVLYLLGLGDLVEQCSGHYAMQAFQTDLDRREQMRVVRRLLLKYVDTLMALVPRIVLAAVPGNHGENRDGGGKAFTTFSDNDDLAVFDGIAEILAANPERYEGRVSVKLASGLSDTLDVAGVVVGMTHMHAGKSGSNPHQKVMNWWRGHALGRGKVHDADLLFTAHYHHLVVDESCGRTWFQCPAQDPGSSWFTEATGQHSPSGMLTVAVGLCYGDRKWGDMAVL